MSIRSEILVLWHELQDMQKNYKGTQEERDKAHEIVTQIEALDLKNRANDLDSRYGFSDKKPNCFYDGLELGSNYRSYPKVFNSFGEQMLSIARAFTPGGETDPRLYKVRAATGLSETNPVDGGFLLSPQYSSEIWRVAFDTGSIMSRVRTIPIKSNSIKINAIAETSRASTRWGGLLGYWLAEAADKQASKPSFRQMELSLKKLVLLVYSTDELLEDAATLENVLRAGFIHETQFKIEDAIINGTGVGMPLGILNSACLVGIARNTASDIKIQDIVGMWARLIPGSHQNAVWLVNATVIPKLYQITQTVGTGGNNMFIAEGDLSKSPASTLMGRPVIITEHCEALGTKGDIILSDLSQYLLATAGATKVDSSMHVRFVNDETVSEKAAPNSNVETKQLPKRGNLNSKKSMAIPCQAEAFMPWACVETIQKQTYLS